MGFNMVCQYNFELPLDPLPLLEMARQVIIENGGTVMGHLPNISLSIPTQVGRFDGVCTLVSASVVNIAITKKPDIVSCTMIRDKLTFFLTEAVRMQARLAQNSEVAPARVQ